MRYCSMSDDEWRKFHKKSIEKSINSFMEAMIEEADKKLASILMPIISDKLNITNGEYLIDICCEMVINDDRCKLMMTSIIKDIKIFIDEFMIFMEKQEQKLDSIVESISNNISNKENKNEKI